jgi:spermidine synthase
MLSAPHPSTDIPKLLKKRGISTVWIRNYFKGNMPEVRIQGLREAVDPAAPVNTDLRPGLIRIMFQQWFLKFDSSPAVFVVVLVLVSALYVLRSRRHEFVIFSTGAMVMGAETLVIFTFQAFYGYVYFLIGVIITVFLAGLMPGAIMASRLRQEQCLPLLRYCDMTLAALMSFFVFWIYTQGGQATPAWSFLLFGFLVSFLCGLQFPAVLKLQGDTGSSVAGTLSADIVGAGLGSLLVSLVLIPYGGFVAAGAGLILLKAASLAVLYRS